MLLIRVYLQWAVRYGRIDICRLLLGAGADTNVEDDYGRSVKLPFKGGSHDTY